jgi:hypothetical protein
VRDAQRDAWQQLECRNGQQMVAKVDGYPGRGGAPLALFESVQELCEFHRGESAVAHQGVADVEVGRALLFEQSVQSLGIQQSKHECELPKELGVPLLSRLNSVDLGLIEMATT